MERIFAAWFTVVRGLAVEHYYFRSVEHAERPSARDAQDTLYITDNLVLRTHTFRFRSDDGKTAAACPDRGPRPGVSTRRGRRHPQPHVPPDGGLLVDEGISLPT
jgi:hypothetical protein